MKQQEASDRVCQMLLDVQDIIGKPCYVISSQHCFTHLRAENCQL